MARNTDARLWAKVDKRGPDECWPWVAYVDEKGYGRFGLQGENCYAHRVAYELTIGPIEDGLHLDHTCHDPENCAGGPTCPHRRCVNPTHLEPVTPLENTLRGVSARRTERTYCPAGHALAGDNLRFDSKGFRACRICARDSQRRHRERKQAA